MYAIHKDESEVQAALAQCRGVYQENLIMGRESLSTATLRGKARNYADRYKRSAANLIARCKAAGISIREETGSHNKRLLVIGD